MQWFAKKAPSLMKQPPKPLQPPKTLVLSGGGVKGISFIGCVRNLEDRGLLKGVHNLIGTSFGSLVCYMLALGMSSEDMLALVLESLDVDNPPKAPARRDHKSCLYSIIRCIESSGFDDGTHLETCIKRPLIERHERSDISFLEFAKLTGKNLVIIGSNITLAASERFSLETTPDMSVIRALRVSTSIPLLFEPVVIDRNVYMDGALFKNFALDLALHSSVDDVVGLLIEDELEHAENNNNNLSILYVAKLLVYAMLKRLNHLDATEVPPNVKIVRINSAELLDAVLSKEKREKSASTVAAFYSMDTMSFLLTLEEAEAMMRFGFDKMADVR